VNSTASALTRQPMLMVTSKSTLRTKTDSRLRQYCKGKTPAVPDLRRHGAAEQELKFTMAEKVEELREGLQSTAPDEPWSLSAFTR
jgi:hypothetical protein